MAGAHRGVRRRDALAHAGRIDRERRRVLEDARAVLLGIGREAERVIERMDVERCREMQRLKIVRAAQHFAHLLGRPGFHVGAKIDAQHRGMLDQGPLVVDAAHREPALARLRMRHIGRGTAHVLDTLLGQRPQLLRARQPNPVDDRVDPLGKSRRDESAVAPRRTGGDALRFQHRDRPAAPRQLARSREARKPGADHAGIDVEIVVERPPLRRRDHGRRIPGRAVGMVPFGHRPLMPRRQGSRKSAIFPCKIMTGTGTSHPCAA